jgi:hypothetical protein
MLHPHETKKHTAADEYAEARRAWQFAHDVALRDAALAEANAQAVRVPAAEPDRANARARAPQPHGTERTTVRQPQQDERGEKITFRSYGTARGSLVSELLKDAAAHDAGRFDEIGRRSDRMEIPRVGPPELTKLRVALSFWGAWTDARNHSWPPDGNIAKEEWPVLARRIAADIAEDREISDARVGAGFDVSNGRSDG